MKATSDMTADKKYGALGWREFLTNRQELLAEYDRAKEVNRSRPVRVEHGIAGEAAVRAWLEKFLPGQYGVTSGFIVPDIIVQGSYRLLHYDIIIFDKLSTPVLWTDGDFDTSAQGRRRAIPAAHVRAVLEVKSAFNDESSRQAMEKLGQLDVLRHWLPPAFRSYSVFFELDSAVVAKPELLRNLLPTERLTSYCGGLILRSPQNECMTGEIVCHTAESDQTDLLIPLAKDIDALDIALNEQGHAVIREQGAGLVCYSDGVKWHFGKIYGPHVWRQRTGIALQWSHGGFARFCIDLLCRLDGRDPRANVGANHEVNFGQVFDILERSSQDQ